MNSTRDTWSWGLLILIGLVVLVFLVGCTRTEYVEKPVEVFKQVTLPCIEQIPEEPDYETQYLEPDDSIGVVGQAYRIERTQREAYIKTLRCELRGCMNPDGRRNLSCGSEAAD